MKLYSDRFFRVQREYSDGSSSSPEIYRIDDINSDWRMSRKGFLASTALGIASLGFLKNQLNAADKIESSVNDSCGFVPPHGENISGMRINARGDMLATGSSDTTVKLWDFPSGRHLATLKGHTAHVWKLEFTHNSKYLFTSSPKDMMIKMWDVEKKILKCNLEGHTGMVRAMAVTGDDRYLVTGSEDKTLKIWSAEDGKLVKTLQCRDSYFEMIFSPDNSFAMVKGWSNRVAFLDMNKMEFISEVDKAHPDYIIWGISLLPDGNGVSFARDGFKLWNCRTGQLINSYRKNEMECRNISVLPDGKSAVVIHYNSPTEKYLLELVSLPELTVKGMIPEPKAMQKSRFIENGKYLAGVGYDNNIYLYDLEKFEARATVAVPVQRIICPDFSSDGRYLILSGIDKDCYIYSLPDFSIVTCLADGAALDKGKSARIVEMKDSAGRKIVKGLPADRGKPSGSTCTCDTVIGSYVKPVKKSEGGGGYGGSGGGSYCSCNRVCTCVPVK